MEPDGNRYQLSNPSRRYALVVGKDDGSTKSNPGSAATSGGMTVNRGVGASPNFAANESRTDVVDAGMQASTSKARKVMQWFRTKGKGPDQESVGLPMPDFDNEPDTSMASLNVEKQKMDWEGDVSVNNKSDGSFASPGGGYHTNVDDTLLIQDATCSAYPGCLCYRTSAPYTIFGHRHLLHTPSLVANI